MSHFPAHLRRDAGLFALACLLGAAITLGSWLRFADARSTALQARLTAERQTAQLAALDRNRQAILTGIALHAQFVQRGLFDREDRAQLSRQMIGATASRRLAPPYQYFASPPAPLTEPSVTEHLRVFASPMHLRIDLLHEQDLFDVFAELASTASALPRVRRCHLTRLPGPTTVGAAQLHADCLIDWLTIGQPAP